LRIKYCPLLICCRILPQFGNCTTLPESTVMELKELFVADSSANIVLKERRHSESNTGYWKKELLYQWYHRANLQIEYCPTLEWKHTVFEMKILYLVFSCSNLVLHYLLFTEEILAQLQNLAHSEVTAVMKHKFCTLKNTATIYRNRAYVCLVAYIPCCYNHTQTELLE
jgi:hypothetical protein